ncbi:hypothetical protein QJQ45_019382 [Haematococcus lacustris]|nr:hypothetical protein QJQ45_019382 [Haematococcus lacustris]
MRQFLAGRVWMVDDIRTSRVSSADNTPGEALTEARPESFRWLRPVYSKAKRSQVRGLMCATSNNIIRFYDRDVSAALNIRRCAVGPGPRPTELCSWEGRLAMPKPGQPGQEWVEVLDKAMLRKWSRVFLLGPSHHVHTRRCCLSPATAYDTPLGSLTIDQEVYRVLQGTGAFDTMDISTDEAEHSLELLTPFIAFLVAGRPVRLVPIMVGSLSTDSEALYGSLLGPYLDDPSNLFVISSDFCHWGRRFSYTFHDTTQGQPTAFSQYLSKYGNTICGRHPIGVLLNMLQHAATLFNVKFVKYDQSSRCERMNDSSVSYAAATVLPAV